jgi:hypothetical protein
VRDRRPDALPPEERQKLAEATKKMREEQNAVQQKISAIRTELDALVRSAELDETAIRAKAMEIGKLEGDLAMMRGRNFKEMRRLMPNVQLDRAQREPREALGTNRPVRLPRPGDVQRPAVRPSSPQSAPPSRPASTPPQP